MNYNVQDNIDEKQLVNLLISPLRLVEAAHDGGHQQPHHGHTEAGPGAARGRGRVAEAADTPRPPVSGEEDPCSRR